VRPKPVTSHASSIVQVSRWANGIVLGSAAFGADRLTCDCCRPVLSRRLYLTWPSYSQKLARKSWFVRRATSMRTSEGARVRQRMSAALWISADTKGERKFFAITVRHRTEASLPMSASKFPNRSPLFTSVLFNHYLTKAAMAT